jgi:transposase
MGEPFQSLKISPQDTATGKLTVRVNRYKDRNFLFFEKATAMRLRMGTSREEIAAKWKTVVQRAVGKKRAEWLVETARNSIGLTEGLTMARMELQMLLEQYELSIPLVGWATVAGFLSEVGPLTAYDHPQQLIRLAGLNLKENSSGEHKGRTSITKRGRSRLRSLLPFSR